MKKKQKKYDNNAHLPLNYQKNFHRIITSKEKAPTYRSVRWNWFLSTGQPEIYSFTLYTRTNMPKIMINREAAGGGPSFLESVPLFRLLNTTTTNSGVILSRILLHGIKSKIRTYTIRPRIVNFISYRVMLFSSPLWYKRRGHITKKTGWFHNQISRRTCFGMNWTRSSTTTSSFF